MPLYYLRKYLYPALHSIRFILEKLAEHTFPRKKDQTRKHKCAYQIYFDHQMKMCAEKFHDLFKTSINAFFLKMFVTFVKSFHFGMYGVYYFLQV